jgi:hypothetical protein
MRAEVNGHSHAKLALSAMKLLKGFVCPRGSMYRPNFCNDCGKKILRLHWHPWTSGRFCDDCEKRLWRERLRRPLIASALLIGIGFVTGKALRPSPPPLIIQRASANQSTNPGKDSGQNEPAALVVDDVYICGARTRRGTPCSRRVHGNVRCWQHKGSPAILPREKLAVKE